MKDLPVIEVDEFIKIIEAKETFSKRPKAFTLDPVYHTKTRDQCRVILRKDHIELNATIDGVGNSFRLYYERIRRPTK